MYTLIIEDKHGGIADEYSFEEGEFYIGRSHTSDIILPSDNVSRRHARLYTVDGKCYIEDLNSSNGVFVNGRRIQEVYQIQRSAQIKVGDYYLHIESDADQGAEEDKTYCKLTGRNLAFVNQVFRVQRKVNLMGRGKDCTLTVIDPSVSRIHAKLSIERSGALTLEDLKSSNGTFVNDERVEVATLAHRDVIRLGNVEFLIEFPDQDSVSGQPPKVEARDRREKAPRKPETTGKRQPDTAERPSVAASERASKADRLTGQGKAERISAPDRATPGSKDRGLGAERPAKPERKQVEVDRPAAALAAPLHDYSKPVDASVSRDRPARASLAEELWPDERPGGSKTVWIVAAVTVLVVTGGILFAFKDSLFRDAPAEAPVATTAPPTQPTTAPPPEGKPAPPEPSSKEKRQREIASIIEKGNEAIKEKNWAYARERFEVVLDLDPLNDTARGAVNRIIAWQADKTRLDEARRMRDALKRGEAAKKLREIADTSVYYAEAQQGLRELMDAKGTLELDSSTSLKNRDCEAAIAKLREIQLIDPKDPTLSVKIEDIEKLLGTRRCKE